MTKLIELTKQAIDKKDMASKHLAQIEMLRLVAESRQYITDEMLSDVLPALVFTIYGTPDLPDDILRLAIASLRIGYMIAKEEETTNGS